MKQTHRMTHIRQLCGLGMHWNMVSGEILREIQALIPSTEVALLRLDEDDLPASELAALELAETDLFERIQLCQRLEPEINQNMRRWMEGNRILSDLQVLSRRFYETETFHLTMRPEGHHFVMAGQLFRHAPRKAVLGLTRPPGRGYSAKEHALLEHLLPYVEHALRRRHAGGDNVPFAKQGRSAMLVMDEAGKIIYACDEGRKLMFLATCPESPADAPHQGYTLQAPAALVKVCQDLSSLFKGHKPCPPSLVHHNARGQFIFHAAWLSAQNREPGGLIGVTIEHREPLVLRLVRGLKNTTLAPVQREVCVQFCLGHSQEEIAGRLHIKPSTVKDHLRKVYDKFDVHQRERLTTRLLAEG